MTPRLQISEREWAVFRRDAARLAAMSSRTAAEFYNSKAYTICKVALDSTKRASRQEIEALGLKTVSLTERITSSGRKRNVRKFKFEGDNARGNYLAALIHQRGGKGANDYIKSKFGNIGQFSMAARRWIAKKLRSIGFLASTWRPILRKLDRYAAEKGKVDNPTRSQHHAVMSFAKPATEKRPVVEFGNVIGSDKYGNALGEKPQNLLMIAFRKAWFGELRSQAERLRDKLKEAAKRSGATVR